MDCNKEEAVRAKGIAEMKLQSRDFQLARTMALKAKQLDPNVDNISQLIMVCEVHCSAEKKFCGEMDWYGILQVPQAADEATIKKQYKKFALFLHPDKNKLPGAEAAFKLIGEAQRILSDHTSRAAYDRKINSSLGRPASQGVPFSRFAEPYRPPHGANWYSNVGLKSHYESNFSGNNAPPQQSAQAVFSGDPTFWTFCPFCSMHHRYYRNIMNKSIACQTCQKVFVAYEINFSGAPRAASSQQGAFTNDIKVDVGSKPTSTLGSRKQESFPKRSNAMAKPRGGNRRERREKENYIESDILDSKSTSDSDNGSVMCDDTKSKDNQGHNKCSSEQAVRRSTRQRQHVSYKETGSDEDENLNPTKKSKGSRESLHVQNGAQEEVKLEGDDHAGRVPILSSPQPGFNDFSKDRGEECFAVGKVWAIYDSHDNMPRSYALIRKLFRPGSKVKITWFTPDADGVDEINWIKAGFPVAVGNFKLGKGDFIDNFRMFSHEVMWDKGHGKGPLKVFPMLGETWALFKHWDMKWSYDANRKFAFEVVEILCDYNEENVITVAYLGKLKGFGSLFCRTAEEGRNIFRIHRSELYRFSHRIPSFKLTGSEGENIPAGSFELDPAALPTNLDETTLPEESKAELVSDGCSDHCDSNSSEDSCVALSEEASNGSQIPEPVFHNFDDAKSPENFRVGQIWALYSDEDSLPKYYGLITQVTTQPEFKLHLSWLASHSLLKGGLRWRDRKMLISCGRFRIDKCEPVCYETTDAFSHCLNASISWEKDGTWNILPGKGEIWAMYKNWSSGIRSSGLGDCDYDLVEVIEVDESAITVVMLERLSRFSCVHKPQSHGSSRVTLRIPLVEILRFSHQVPAFQLTDQKKGSLRGFWEVDPLALPARSFALN